MGARYYHPTLGRFTGIDPVGFTQANLHSHNRYTYANNNPYKFVDPDGRVAVPVATGLIGFGIDVAAQVSVAYWGGGKSFTDSVKSVNYTDAAIAGVTAAITGNIAGKSAIQAAQGLVSASKATTNIAVIGGTVAGTGNVVSSLAKGEPVNPVNVAVNVVTGGIGSGVGGRLGNSRAAELQGVISSRDGIANHIGTTTQTSIGKAGLGTSLGLEAGKLGADFGTSVGGKSAEQGKTE